MAKKIKFPEKLAKYLEKVGAKHNILEHRTVYTAYDAAATMKKKMGEIAKSLLVMADKNYYLVILPADYNLDFKKLSKIISKQINQPVKTIKIPNEKVMIELLKLRNEAMSAFGGFHKLPVIMDKKLSKAKSAIFSSGSFNHSVEMAVKDFVKYENAILGEFGIKKKIKIQKIIKPKRAKKKISKVAKKNKPKKKR